MKKTFIKTETTHHPTFIENMANRYGSSESMENYKFTRNYERDLSNIKKNKKGEYVLYTQERTYIDQYGEGAFDKIERVIKSKEIVIGKNESEVNKYIDDELSNINPLYQYIYLMNIGQCYNSQGIRTDKVPYNDIITWTEETPMKKSK